MQNQDPKDLLLRIVGILEKLNISYFVTGGIAVLIWGRPRFTADIDIVVEVHEKDLPQLQSALKDLSPFGYIELDAMKEALHQNSEFNYIDGNTGMKVDFWILTKSKFDQSRLTRRKVKHIFDSDIYFTSA